MMVSLVDHTCHRHPSLPTTRHTFCHSLLHRLTTHQPSKPPPPCPPPPCPFKQDDGALPVWSTVAIGIGLFLACFTVCVLGGYLVYEKVPGVKEWLSERALYNSRANPKHPPITRTTADPVV